MRIVIAGGSGFLGGALRRSFVADGHAVTNLTRRAATKTADVTWLPDGTAGAWAETVNAADAVINLAGAPLADQSWTPARKEIIGSSRLLATRSIVAAITRAARPPAILVNASGVGYYGPRGDELVTEATPPGDDFVARLCVDWEREAEQASHVTRVAIVRTGLALHPSGGALSRMLLPFRLGIGGPLGAGRQFVPWIHRDDWIELVKWLIAEPAARGAFNATSPNPVTSAEFAGTLGRVLRRPAFLPAPAFALRLLFGEMADLLLTGQRAIPQRALEMGFNSRFPQLEGALNDLLSD